MKLSTVFSVTAVITFIFGVAFILAPVATISLYGSTLEGVGVFIARYFGAALLGFAFLAWLNRNTTSKGVPVGFFAGMVLGFVVALYDAFAGTHNALVWMNVVIYLVLGAGFGYYSFMKAT